MCSFGLYEESDEIVSSEGVEVEEIDFDEIIVIVEYRLLDNQ